MHWKSIHLKLSDLALKVPQLLPEANGRANGHLFRMQFFMMLKSYLHLPYFLLKVHQLVLKTSSDADGDLRMGKSKIDCLKRQKDILVHLQALHKLLQPLHLVLKVPHLEMQIEKVKVKRLLHLLFHPSLSLCHTASHLWNVNCILSNFVLLFLIKPQHISSL